MSCRSGDSTRVSFSCFLPWPPAQRRSREDQAPQSVCGPKAKQGNLKGRVGADGAETIELQAALEAGPFEVHVDLFQGEGDTVDDAVDQAVFASSAVRLVAARRGCRGCRGCRRRVDHGLHNHTAHRLHAHGPHRARALLMPHPSALMRSQLTMRMGRRRSAVHGTLMRTEAQVAAVTVSHAGSSDAR